MALNRPLTVLSIAHPLAPVGEHAVGGAEQVLTILDRALTQAGHRSRVIACEGSQIAGELLSVPLPPPPYDEHAARQVQEAVRERMRAALAQERVDVVHIHALDFDKCLTDAAACLVTLHMPRSFYTAAAFRARRDHVWFNCVSASQRAAYADLGAALLPAIENGVAVETPAREPKENFALVLARVCWEKGIHVAAEAARAARTPLLIAGQVFPYPEHERYFREQIQPRLGDDCRFLGPVSGARKRRLLAQARCLVVPSLVPESSSLVAREALACGTPVVAYDHGALSSLIAPGETGFLVRSVADMAQGIVDAARLDPARCRESVRRQFSIESMTRAYFAMYEELAERFVMGGFPLPCPSPARGRRDSIRELSTQPLRAPVESVAQASGVRS